MSICFAPLVHKTDSSIFTRPPEARTDPDGYEFSVCNANGADLLLALGLTPEPCGDLPIEAFSGRVTAALRRRLGQRSPAIPTSIDQAPGRITIIDGGRREGYLEARLGDLARLIQRSRAAGATHIGWG